MIVCMIRLLKQGKYSLIETFDHTKILVLDDKTKLAWINAAGIGDILVAIRKEFKPSSIVSSGSYRMYDVKDEPDLTDLKHLELFVGDGNWQGYLLPKGLPNGVKRHRIVATREVITRAPLQAL